VAINPTALANINAGLMPAQVTGPIFAKASETSAVMSLAKRIPLAVNAQTNIPVPFDLAVPDWVGEGGVKPASQVGTGMKSMQGKKLALIVPVSTEVVMTNPAGVVDQLRSDLPTGIARRSTTPPSTASRCAPVPPVRSPTSWRTARAPRRSAP
jgi:HK97 family phage major capsid protein